MSILNTKVCPMDFRQVSLHFKYDYSDWPSWSYGTHGFTTTSGFTKPGEVGDFFALVSMKSPHFLSKSEVLVALSVFSSQYFFHQYSYFFFNIHVKGAPMFLKFDPFRVWCSIFYSKLIKCILFKIIVQHVRVVKGRGTCGSGERNIKIWSIFGSLPDFPSLHP